MMIKEVICFLWGLLPKRWFSVDERFIVRDMRLVHVKTHLLFYGRRIFTVLFERVAL